MPRTPLLLLTTRRAVELQLERAAAALPAGTTVRATDDASRELLGEVWILPGAYRVDKRNLPAEPGKGVSCKEKGQGRSAKLERLLRD